MGHKIPVAHDFCCPWCWIGLHQAKRLKADFGVEIEWLSYELFPEGVPIPQAKTREEPPDKAPTPSRIQLAYAAEGLTPPSDPAPDFNAHNAHEAVEFAREQGVEDVLVDRIYRAWWEHRLAINSPQVLAVLAKGLVADTDEMLHAIESRRFAHRIVPFDEEAHARGVYNVPTYWIGDRRYAEQPYRVLREAVQNLASRDPAPAQEIYPSLLFPPAPEHRPYTFINMVATIDGKTVSGQRDQPVMDLGSELDHEVMRRIEAASDAIMVGAGSLRATPGLWYPKDKVRIVVTRSGNIDLRSRFFSDAPEMAVVAGSKKTIARLGDIRPTRAIATGTEEVNPIELMRILRDELGIERLLVEGGSELNATLLEPDLVDELFLTLAPKIKLGRSTPTYAGGEPLPRERMHRYSLLEQHRAGDEVLLRYRRIQDSELINDQQPTTNNQQPITNNQ